MHFRGNHKTLYTKILLMNKTDYCIVTTTVDTEKSAKEIARTLLEARLAACIQIFPIESLYHWEGAVAESREFLLQMKTRSGHFPAIQEQIEQLHSYDIPEIIMTPLLDANEAYLAWIDEETL